MTQAAERAHVVSVAHTWLRTPYVHAARVKGQGVDCLTLLAGVFEEAGLLSHVDIPAYPKDWHLHHSAELYLDGLLRYAHEIDGPPQPGDIALWKIGRTFSHGAIVVRWSQVIHAFIGRCVMLEDAEAAQHLKYIGEGKEDLGKPRPRRFFSYW
jgi:cell wall-associated NlpC family hydrolase